MLNEADSYQGGGSAGAEASEPVKDAEALFRKLKRFCQSRLQQQRPSQLAARGARRFRL